MKADTRQLILNKAYEHIKLYGYQGLRTDKVIEALGITKGALYHYFPGKKELGYAVVDEVLAGKYADTWSGLKGYEDNALDFIIITLEWMLKRITEKEIRLGDPLTNLIQEMSALDEGFRVRLETILGNIQGLLQTALKKGKKGGNVKESVPARQTSIYILATLQGAFSLAKVYQSRKIFVNVTENLIIYLKDLKI